MPYRFIALSSLLSAASLLGACSGFTCGNTHTYLDSPARGPLRAPPGVTVPAPDSTYVIPGATTAVAPASAPCMIRPPQLVPKEAPVTPPVAAPAGSTTRRPSVAAPPPME